MAGFSGNSEEELLSGINVTPLVDVVLVLLIIFLITAPVIYQSAIKVQLPQARSGEESGRPHPLSFTLDREGVLYWNNRPADWNELPAKLAPYAKNPASTEGASVAADRATPHGTVVRLMDILRMSGITKFSLTVESKR